MSQFALTRKEFTVAHFATTNYMKRKNESDGNGGGVFLVPEFMIKHGIADLRSPGTGVL